MPFILWSSYYKGISLISKEHGSFSCLWNLRPIYKIVLRNYLWKGCIYGLIDVFVTRQFPVFIGCYFFCYCLQKAESAQIAQINQLFQLFNLICAYGYTFYRLTLMLMSKNVKQCRQQRFTYYIKNCTYHMHLYCTSLLFSFFQWCLPLHFYFNCCSTFILKLITLVFTFLF